MRAPIWTLTKGHLHRSGDPAPRQGAYRETSFRLKRTRPPTPARRAA